ncbi:hypothetical protein EMCRGX_G010813 [Ephydatia muelleri]
MCLCSHVFPSVPLFPCVPLCASVPMCFPLCLCYHVFLSVPLFPCVPLCASVPMCSPLCLCSHVFPSVPLFPCVPLCASVPMCSPLCLCSHVFPSVPLFPCVPLCASVPLSSPLNADLILLFARQAPSERVGHVQVCVMVSSGHVERPTQVYISTEDMSATEGTEYTPLHSYPLLFSRGHQENDSLCVAIGIQHNNCTTGTLSFGVLLLDTTGVVERAVIRIEDIDVMEIDFEKTNYVFSEAAVVPLCVKIYSGQLATELVLKVQSYDESAHGGVDYILVNQSVTFNRGHTVYIW